MIILFELILAIIINPKFTASTNNEIWNTINGHIEKFKKDIFKQVGVSVNIYTRVDIKLTRGNIYFVKIKQKVQLGISNYLNYDDVELYLL